MKLQKELEKRLDRIVFIVEATTKKIIRKELKNFKRDIIKGMLKK